MSGSYCSVCQEDSGVDAEDWSRQHDHRAEPAICQSCGAKLKAYYDEYESEGGFWAFEPIEDTTPLSQKPST